MLDEAARRIVADFEPERTVVAAATLWLTTARECLEDGEYRPAMKADDISALVDDLTVEQLHAALAYAIEVLMGGLAWDSDVKHIADPQLTWAEAFIDSLARDLAAIEHVLVSEVFDPTPQEDDDE